MSSTVWGAKATSWATRLTCEHATLGVETRLAGIADVQLLRLVGVRFAHRHAVARRAVCTRGQRAVQSIRLITKRYSVQQAVVTWQAWQQLLAM